MNANNIPLLNTYPTFLSPVGDGFKLRPSTGTKCYMMITALLWVFSLQKATLATMQWSASMLPSQGFCYGSLQPWLLSFTVCFYILSTMYYLRKDFLDITTKYKADFTALSLSHLIFLYLIYPRCSSNEGNVHLGNYTRGLFFSKSPKSFTAYANCAECFLCPGKIAMFKECDNCLTLQASVQASLDCKAKTV